MIYRSEMYDNSSTDGRDEMIVIKFIIRFYVIFQVILFEGAM